VIAVNGSLGDVQTIIDRVIEGLAVGQFKNRPARRPVAEMIKQIAAREIGGLFLRASQGWRANWIGASPSIGDTPNLKKGLPNRSPLLFRRRG